MADAPVVKQGTWGEDTKKTARRRGEPAAEEDERLKMTVPVEEESDDEIPEIPELQDEPEEEDITTQVAEAPSANIKVATMADLDKELSSSIPFTQTESGIDLKLLINNLTPSHQLKEEDKEWDFVHVFTDIKSELVAAEDTGDNEESKELADNPIASI